MKAETLAVLITSAKHLDRVIGNMIGNPTNFIEFFNTRMDKTAQQNILNSIDCILIACKELAKREVDIH